MEDRLAAIMARKRAELERRGRPVREEELARFAGIRPGGRFEAALRAPEGLAVIAEIKRKSPSAGVIAGGLDAVEQARLYLNGGAQALSILTEEEDFGGHIRDLADTVDFLRDHQREIPCLRKDFLVHPLEVLEAAEAGAAAILLIVRSLSVGELERLREAADLAGLDCLYEVHSEAELEIALALEPRILGVNNRDLATFTVDLATTEQLVPQIPDHMIAVSESGILGPAEAARAREAGASALLVGESLLRSEDVGAALRALQEA